MSSSPYWLHTERLMLRRFAEDDLDWFAALYADPDVTRHLGGVRSRAQVTELFETRVLAYYDANPGMGVWMTVDRGTTLPVGFHLINNIQGETLIQVGYGLEKSAWGRGYATEMALALVRYAFLELGLERLCAIANLENIASQHVLTKIGLERRGERAFPHPAYAAQGPMAWFEREAVAWRRVMAPPGLE